jgi:hypothetical protein
MPIRIAMPTIVLDGGKGDMYIGADVNLLTGVPEVIIGECEPHEVGTEVKEEPRRPPLIRALLDAPATRAWIAVLQTHLAHCLAREVQLESSPESPEPKPEGLPCQDCAAPTTAESKPN